MRTAADGTIGDSGTTSDREALLRTKPPTDIRSRAKVGGDRHGHSDAHLILHVVIFNVVPYVVLKIIG